ncbi:hypothetical protein V2J09_013224 [Rumex salicifolius]
MGNGYDLNRLLQDAQSRWLKPDQLLFIIQNHEPWMIQQRNNVPSFRKDGHKWCKRPNKNTVKEGHENLKNEIVVLILEGYITRRLAMMKLWLATTPKELIILTLGGVSTGCCTENKDIVLVHYMNNTEFSTGQSHTIPQSPKEVETGLADKAAKSFKVEMSRDRLLQELLDQNYKNGKHFISFGGQSMHGTAAFGCDNSGKELDQGYRGTFSCDPSETICAMFGNIEVTAQIIQDGVICCEAPSNCPGKVTFCITSGNREYYSEVKEFEYRDSESACKICSKPQQEEERRMEEAKLLVEFVGMLSSGSSLQKGENNNFCISSLRMHKGYEYATGYNTEALLKGHGTSYGIIDWVLQEVLKDKLQTCITWSGVPVSVTDLTAQDPMGKNAASIAEANGHEGLAAYLSAFALTTRFSAFDFEEAQVEVSNTWNEFDEDEIRMIQVLKVNDKASNSKAAELIETAFRGHSFRREQQREEAANRGEADECGLICDEIQHVSAAMFKNKNVAALTIQKYYRDRKRHNHFQTVCEKVVRIQAHLRGCWIRKYYRAIQAVSNVNKIILRCRQERCGLRGFKLPGGEAMNENEEEEDEDILLAEEEEKEAQEHRAKPGHVDRRKPMRLDMEADKRGGSKSIQILQEAIQQLTESSNRKPFNEIETQTENRISSTANTILDENQILTNLISQIQVATTLKLF